jgi:hypothetical protein
MAGYVRELYVVGEGMHESGVMEQLRGVGEACRMLSVLSLREVGFNAVQHASRELRIHIKLYRNTELTLSPLLQSSPA